MKLRKLSVAKDILLAKQAASLYYLSASSPSGIKVWYVLALSPDKEGELLMAIQQTGVMLDLQNFGEIVATGEGENAPDEVLKKVEERYAVTLQQKA